MINTLSLDLGRSTGWSIAKEGLVIDSGTILLATKNEDVEQHKQNGDRFYDIRFKRLIDFITDKALSHDIRRIVFEDVLFASSAKQVQLWTTFRAAIWATVYNYPNRLQAFCVAVGTLKMFATGRGDAEKSDMLAALKAKNLFTSTSLDKMDDNEVDAIWLSLYAMEVDCGHKCFLGPYQRKMQEKEEKRARKKSNKLEAGKCPTCKVNRRVTSKNIVCPKCGTKTLREKCQTDTQKN